jgi:hypothetical protein
MWKHRKWFADKGELGELIFNAKNLPEFEKRVQWLGDGSLKYHLTQFSSPWIHGGIPEEHELYKEFMKYALNNNTMGKTYKDMKKSGKHSFEGPNVKDRKKFAPATKVEKPKKGKGSFERDKSTDEDEELGVVPLKGGKSVASKRKVVFGDEDGVPMKDGSKPKRRPLEGKRKNRYEFNESVHLINFIEAIITKNHAEAHEHLKNAVNEKLQERIAQEINTPLF